ncbi:hypothetical protein ACA910_017607 [Epithemia clementina (nom. ined.)]
MKSSLAAPVVTTTTTTTTTTSTTTNGVRNPGGANGSSSVHHNGTAAASATGLCSPHAASSFFRNHDGSSTHSTTAAAVAAGPPTFCGGGNPYNNNNTSSTSSSSSTTALPLNLFKVLVGNCYYSCEQPLDTNNDVQLLPPTQFVELHGIRFIGLGCMADELTPRERVYDTLEQLTDRSERLLSIGYIVDAPSSASSSSSSSSPSDPLSLPSLPQKTTQTIPLDVWNNNNNHNHNNNNNNNNNKSSVGDPHNPTHHRHQMDRPVQKLVEQILNKDYKSAKMHLSMQLATQKKNWNKGHNRYLAGITAHNLAVVKILSRHDDEAEEWLEPYDMVQAEEEDILQLFREAIQLKEHAFGQHNPEVAYSWDELGIQLYANNQFEQALSAFSQAQKVRVRMYNNNNNNNNTTTTGDAAPVHLSSASWAASSVASTSSHTTTTTTTTTTTAQQQQQQQQRHIPLSGGGVAMVLNNIACCKFQLKQFPSALKTLQEALAVQQQQQQQSYSSVPPLNNNNNNNNNNNGTTMLVSSASASTTNQHHHPFHHHHHGSGGVTADLDLLYHAIVMCNCGYLHLCLKLYDEARCLFEEALLIQQSVLDESHRAIRDTRSNLEFTNAFHL